MARWVEEHPRRLDVLVLAASVLFHFLLGLAVLAWRVVPVQPANVREETKDRMLAFRLVETPESARAMEPPRQATALSDKNARAQNTEAPADLEEGDPYSPLRSELFEQGGGEGVEAAAPGSMSGEGAAGASQPVPPEEVAPIDRRNSDAFLTARGQLRPKFTPEVLGQPREPSGQPRAGGGQQTSKARFLGDFSLNTYAWDYAPYILHMKRKIANNLYPPPAFTRLGIISGQVVLRFTVMPDGEVKDVRIESYDCHPSLVETSMLAVKNSSPFRPLPRDFPEPQLELRWTFLYVVYGREDK